MQSKSTHKHEDQKPVSSLEGPFAVPSLDMQVVDDVSMQRLLQLRISLHALPQSLRAISNLNKCARDSQQWVCSYNVCAVADGAWDAAQLRRQESRSAPAHHSHRVQQQEQLRPAGMCSRADLPALHFFCALCNTSWC